MKQLHFWQTEEPVVEKKIVSWQLFIDGASRRNPGPAALGFVLKKDGEVIFQQGFYIGTKTNNQAEYYALVIGAFFAKKYIKKEELLTIVSDSQLLVRQMIGVYKVKDEGLRQLKNLAVSMLQGFSYKIEHVLREYNKLADEMANRGIDKKIILPLEVLQMLEHHGISI